MVTITFVDVNGNEHLVTGKEGQNLMTVATHNDIPGIDGECGGEMACGTCHVYIDSGSADLPPCSEEAEMLEALVADQRDNSRLGCQVKVTSGLDSLRVTVV